MGTRFRVVNCSIIKVLSMSYFKGVEANQPIHSYLGGRIAVIQQETNVWIGSPSSFKGKSNKNETIWILPNQTITHAHIVFSFYLKPLSIHAVKFNLPTKRFWHLALIPSNLVHVSPGLKEQTNSFEQCYDDFSSGNPKIA